MVQGGLGQSPNPWIPIGYPWHSHLWVDWDPGQSSPFKADWDSVGQCEMDWDNAYPLDSWHWHPWVDWDSWNPGTILDLRHPSRQTNPWIPHWISMALAFLGSGTV